MLAHSGPAKAAELHRGLAHKQSTLTSILDRLAKRNLITREIGKNGSAHVYRHADRERPQTCTPYISSHLLELEREVARDVTAAEIKGFKKVVPALEQQAH